MEKLLACVKDLKKGKVRDVIDSRLNDFKDLGKQSNDELFKELCFCLLTANYSAEGGIRIQQTLEDGFLTLTEGELAEKLKELGHRFPQARAKYIVGARKHRDSLRNLVSSGNEHSAREWLAKNVKGLGYKEASHFLRNIGFDSLAILDFHIIDILVKHGLVQRPKTLIPRRYLEIEKVLEKVGKRLGMNMGELDLYLWYIETGKVLK